jgi:hypothetical protein
LTGLGKMDAARELGAGVVQAWRVLVVFVLFSSFPSPPLVSVIRWFVCPPSAVRAQFSHDPRYRLVPISLFIFRPLWMYFLNPLPKTKPITHAAISLIPVSGR